jgi:hypothetical protein
MTAPKVGRRVRVVLEGEVVSACRDSFYVSGSWVHFEGPGVSVEILRPPVKVGDVIETAEELDALPLWTAVLTGDRVIAQYGVPGWYVAGSEELQAMTTLVPATVLYVPDGDA